jgi:hypothetical protein
MIVEMGTRKEDPKNLCFDFFLGGDYLFILRKWLSLELSMLLPQPPEC